MGFGLVSFFQEVFGIFWDGLPMFIHTRMVHIYNYIYSIYGTCYSSDSDGFGSMAQVLRPVLPRCREALLNQALPGDAWDVVVRLGLNRG